MVAEGGTMLQKLLQSHPRRSLGLAIHGWCQMQLAPGTAEPHVLQELSTAEITLETTEGSHSQVVSHITGPWVL